MSQSDSELQSSLEDIFVAPSGGGVKRWRVGNREVEYHGPTKGQLADILTMRGLQSPRRGLNLGKIDRAG